MSHNLAVSTTVVHWRFGFMLPLRSSLIVLGLAAPMASNAASLNLAEVSQYASQEQVTSISQFSDVKPTDWAYQALSNLVERYGCVAG